MTLAPRVRPLEWDSHFWGVRAAQITIDSADQLAQCDAECRELGIDWASLLLPIGRIDLLNAAVEAGYQVVDVRHALQKTLADTATSPPIELASLADADAMANIASAAFPVSRFFVDRHLDDERCAEFYRTWVRNSFNGEMADAAVVSRSRGEVDGFITLRAGSEGSCSLSLVAVREDRRGEGIARRLVDGALDWMIARGLRSANVVTQLANVPAVRLYESAGFRTIESSVWLHRWFRSDP